MTEAILPKRDINVVQALPVQMGRFGGEAGYSRVDVWRGLGFDAPDTLSQRWRRGKQLESGIWHCEG